MNLSRRPMNLARMRHKIENTLAKQQLPKDGTNQIVKCWKFGTRRSFLPALDGWYFFLTTNGIDLPNSKSETTSADISCRTQKDGIALPNLKWRVLKWQVQIFPAERKKETQNLQRMMKNGARPGQRTDAMSFSASKTKHKFFSSDGFCSGVMFANGWQN